MPRGGGPEKASFEQETNTPYHPTAATRAAGPLGQAGAQGLCGSRPESSHRQAPTGTRGACAPSKHQCSPEAQEASRSNVPPRGPGSVQIVPPTQRPRKRPDPVSHPEAQEASRSSVPPKGPGSVQIQCPTQRPRKHPDPVSPKGPGSVQTQGDCGLMMSAWTAGTWTCPSSRQTSQHRRCLARWRPRLGHLECVVPSDAHWCSQGGRPEQSGEAVCGSCVSVRQDVSS